MPLNVKINKVSEKCTYKSPPWGGGEEGGLWTDQGLLTHRPVAERIDRALMNGLLESTLNATSGW